MKMFLLWGCVPILFLRCMGMLQAVYLCLYYTVTGTVSQSGPLFVAI